MALGRGPEDQPRLISKNHEDINGARMNYRHIYHAGNAADVLKHIVLARLVTYLKGKDKAFRVVDTHAGIGLYDLASVEAQKTGEWRDGIGRVLAAQAPDDIAALIAPWLEAVRAVNPDLDGKGTISAYPGSPVIARYLMRKQDRLSAIELHPDDCETLKERFAGDFQTRVIHLDGWLALGAHMPPKEKRGLVLIDPPFEEAGEYERMAEGLKKAWSRFPGGMYCLWYPIKRGALIAAFHKHLQSLAIPKMLAAELVFRSDSDTTGLTGSGVILVNPPFTLADELKRLLPWLVSCLGQDSFATQRLITLAGETIRSDDA